MTNSIRKIMVASMLSLAVLMTSVAPSAMAQTYRRRQDVYTQNRDYDRRYDDRYYDYDRRSNTKDALKRTGIGAAIGAAGGGLMGGKKGALIGGLIGAAGGYIYHKQKEKNDRYRY